MTKKPLIKVETGDILHVPFPQNCLQFLAVSRDLIVEIEAEKWGPHPPVTLDRFGRSWSGIHTDVECRGETGEYGEPRMVWNG